MMTGLLRQTINKAWKWRLANANGQSQAVNDASLKEWTPVSSFPSVIQAELLSKKIIPDWKIEQNERLVQWVGEADWEYSAEFPTPTGLDSAQSMDLVFEGLDTFATVHLNDSEILKTDNMFVPYRVDVKSLLKPSGEKNQLTILFESSVKKGAELENEFGKGKSLFRSSKRLHVRKAQYHWGWDWGPILITAGPYLPIHLETYSARIVDVYVTSDLSIDHTKADLTVVVQALGNTITTAQINILDPSSAQVGNTVDVKLDGSGNGSTVISVTDPKLWWPNGQGDQHLYTVSLSLLDVSTTQTLDTKKTRFGIRTIRVVQQPLANAPGKTFMFNVNGRDIFAQGGNWIPADSLLPSITRQRYFDWVRLARYNNLNMIRVWGGGIYETEDFFDACDEMGILVWNDYTLSDGQWPINQKWLDNFKNEVEVQTRRLRSRASLALLCGSNEDFMIEDWVGEKYDFSDHNGPFTADKAFPQRQIFLQLIPEVCARLAPTTQFWPSSPWGDAGKDASDPTYGDIHQWSVWHLDQHPYQKYKDLSGRFVSEFGMHGFPIKRTINVFAPNPEDQQPQSQVIDCHNKGHGAETRIARYLAENFRYSMNFDDYVYCSQLLQSEAYGYSLRDWKRKFNAGSEECAGAIIWQLNDVYPVTSWAYIDYYLRPKPAFYSIRRNYAPISVGVERTPRSRFINEDDQLATQIPTFAVFAHNTTPEAVNAKISFKAYDFHARKYVAVNTEGGPSPEVRLNAGHNTELGELKPHASWTEQSLIVLETTLQDPSSGRVLARFVDWPEPYRYLHWPKDTHVGIGIQEYSSDATLEKNTADATVAYDNIVAVTSNHPVKGCWLEPVYDGTEKEEDPEPLWEDNMFDLLPSETVSVRVQGLKGRKVTARFLADWEVDRPVVQAEQARSGDVKESRL